MDISREDLSSSLSRSLPRLPSLRRLDSVIRERPQHNDKVPLLTLRLSSPSFLNTVVDDETRLSLYTIKTTGNLTTVMRSDPWEGATKTADIRWPEDVAALKGKGKKSSGVQVQMRGQRWMDGGSLLRPASVSGSSRKFSIPSYSHSLKWRQVGTTYWCTAPSVKGPIAIFEPVLGSVAPQLQIFETFRDKYDGRQMSDHQGVSILLLDYILITSLLLATDIREWVQPRREDHYELLDRHTEASVPVEPTGLCSTTGIAMTSTSQWRKIMYGEPIYPKRHGRSNSGHSSSAGSTPHDKLAKVMHGVPIYPKLSSVINFDSSSDSDPENEGSFSSTSPDLAGPKTPSPGVITCWQTNPSLSHPSLDQSLQLDALDSVVQYQPPILPPLVKSRLPQTHTIPTSPISAFPYESRPLSVSPVSRPRSTPPRTFSLRRDPHPPPLPNMTFPRNSRSPSLPTTLLNQPTTARSRPLPRPPDGGAPPLRHARSQQGLAQTSLLDKHGSYNTRNLPSPPIQGSLRQQNVYPLEPAIDAGPAHPSQPFFYPSRAQYPRFSSPFSHPSSPQFLKAPCESDVSPWMRGRPGTASSTGDTSPYEVPPPAYNTINFDE